MVENQETALDDLKRCSITAHIDGHEMKVQLKELLMTLHTRCTMKLNFYPQGNVIDCRLREIASRDPMSVLCR